MDTGTRTRTRTRTRFTPMSNVDGTIILCRNVSSASSLSKLMILILFYLFAFISFRTSYLVVQCYTSSHAQNKLAAGIYCNHYDHARSHGNNCNGRFLYGHGHGHSHSHSHGHTRNINMNMIRDKNRLRNWNKSIISTGASIYMQSNYSFPFFQQSDSHRNEHEYEHDNNDEHDKNQTMKIYYSRAAAAFTNNMDRATSTTINTSADRRSIFWHLPNLLLTAAAISTTGTITISSSSPSLLNLALAMDYDSQNNHDIIDININNNNDSQIIHNNDENINHNFRSAAYGLEEYTNSIVASRDTNISPREVYDSLLRDNPLIRYPIIQHQKQHHQQLQMQQTTAISSKSSSPDLSTTSSSPRALDIGAGAGVSTQVLWEMGYKSIDAIDWSGNAWRRYVEVDKDEADSETAPTTTTTTSYCPPTVQFYELDDERFIQEAWNHQPYDAVVIHFAVNESKAKTYAKTLLNPTHGRLLAPTNTQTDYWLKQNYRVYDYNGNVLYDASDVGAWSVQFQPDVTQDTCQGIWCAPFNGFQKKKF